MRERLLAALRNAGRSLVGGLITGLPLLYTMETWWLAWRLPALLLLAYALLGLALVMAAVRAVGFREQEEGRRSSPGEILRSFTELVLHSFVGSYLVLFLFGVVDATSSLSEVVRLGAIEVVPFGLGAAIANRMLRAAEEASPPGSLTREAAVFLLGALFFALPVAPTEEMELMAAHAGWVRLALVPVLAILLSYLALYELEFRGHRGRRSAFTRPIHRVGEIFGAYALALLVSALLLAAFGHFLVGSLEEGVQKVVVLSFLASIGGSAARVVI